MSLRRTPQQVRVDRLAEVAKMQLLFATAAVCAAGLALITGAWLMPERLPGIVVSVLVLLGGACFVIAEVGGTLARIRRSA